MFLPFSIPTTDPVSTAARLLRNVLAQCDVRGVLPDVELSNHLSVIHGIEPILFANGDVTEAL